MDTADVQVVKVWPRPNSRKELQRFLGFAKFYRRFVRAYSKVPCPLATLTSINRCFSWTPEPVAAYVELKWRFTSENILIVLDPTRQFMV